MLKLPKSFSFPQPKIKPTGPVEIDWRNTIARGLTRLIAVDDLYDPANKSQLTTYGTQQKIIDLDGSGRSFSGGNGLLCGNRSPHNGSFTVLAVAKPTSFPVHGNIVGCHSDLSGLANFQFRITTGAKLEFIPFVANAAKVLTGATTLTANKSYALAATYDASLTVATAKVFVNGAQDAALNVTGAMDTDAAALAIGTRFRYANGTYPADFFTGNIYFVLMFDRALSAREIRSLSDNPYQILKPANDLYYFPVQSGGAYTLTADPGVYSLGSDPVNLTYAEILTADVGVYSLGSDPVTLTYTPAGSYTLTADAGVFSLGSDPVNLLLSEVLVADPGVYLLGSDAVNLTYTPVSTLSAEPGVFTLGSDAINLTYAEILTAEAGVYTLGSSAVNLVLGILETPNCYTWLTSTITDVEWYSSLIDASPTYVISTINGDPTYVVSTIDGDDLYLIGDLC